MKIAVIDTLKETLYDRTDFDYFKVISSKPSFKIISLLVEQT